jgi:hypothetical protein
LNFFRIARPRLGSPVSIVFWGPSAVEAAPFTCRNTVVGSAKDRLDRKMVSFFLAGSVRFASVQASLKNAITKTRAPGIPAVA